MLTSFRGVFTCKFIIDVFIVVNSNSTHVEYQMSMQNKNINLVIFAISLRVSNHFISYDATEIECTIT